MLIEAVIEWMQHQQAAGLRKALQDPEAALATIRRDYLPDPDEDGEDETGVPRLDSVEASESGAVDQVRLESAARAWSRLTKPEQTALIEMVARINENAATDLREQLEINAPIL